MNWEQILGGLALALPATALGYMTYRLSRRKDAVSEQSGIASNHKAGIEQVLEGSNKLIDQLQEENASLRVEAESRRIEADLRATRLEAMTLEVARLRKQYGDNGA